MKRIQQLLDKGYILCRGGNPDNPAHYESPVGRTQSTEIRVQARLIPADSQADDYVDPNAPNDEFLKGRQPIEAEVVSMQEEGKDEVKVKSKNEIPLNLTEKVFYYEQAIKKDEKNILAAKERITFNKIRLKKLQTFIAKQKRDAEKLALDL